MFSRRHLFRYATGALAAGSVASTHSFGEPLNSPSPGMAALQSFSSSVESSPQSPTESYRIGSQDPASQSLGRIDDFWAHIENRPDIKRETLYWLTDGRASFLGAATRFQYLEPYIRPRYEKAGIPVEFGFGLGTQESLFRNYSVSYANARGIWQMQWAGKRYGLQGKDYFDVEKSTDKQLEYLKDLVEDFDWNMELVLVDYNYGPGKRYARYRSRSDAFQQIYNRLPAQTRKFVPRVLSAMAIGIAPEKYGMRIPRIESATSQVKVSRDIHHLELGLLLGTDHWNLGNLNPRESIRVWFKEGEQIAIPKMLETSYHQQIDNHPLKGEFHSFISDVYPAPGQEVRYVVERGDSLGKIASRFRDCGVQGVEHLMLYNGLTSTIIRPGQELLIPCSK